MQTTALPNSSALLQLGGKARLMLSLPRHDVTARGHHLALFAGFGGLIAVVAPGCSDDGFEYAPARDPAGAVALHAVTPDVHARGEARTVGSGRGALPGLRVRGLPVATHSLVQLGPRRRGRALALLDVSREPFDGEDAALAYSTGPRACYTPAAPACCALRWHACSRPPR